MHTCQQHNITEMQIFLYLRQSVELALSMKKNVYIYSSTCYKTSPVALFSSGGGTHFQSFNSITVSIGTYFNVSVEYQRNNSGIPLQGSVRQSRDR